MPRRVARKRNDSFRKTKFTVADRGALRRRAVPGRSELAPARCPGPRLGPRLRTAGSAPKLGRRRRAPGPRSRRRWGGLLLTARRPRLPQRENGRRPRLRWDGGGVDRTFLGLSTYHWFWLQARRGRNKRAPLPAGAGHCATSSSRDGRTAGQRASLASPALLALSSGLWGPASAARALESPLLRTPTEVGLRLVARAQSLPTSGGSLPGWGAGGSEADCEQGRESPLRLLVCACGRFRT